MNYQEEYSEEERRKIENKIYEIIDFHLEKDFSKLEIILKRYIGEEKYIQLLKIMNKSNKDELIFSDFGPLPHITYRKKFFKILSNYLYFIDILNLNCPEIDYKIKRKVKEFCTGYFTNIFCKNISWLLKKKLNFDWINSRFMDDIKKEIHSIYINEPYAY